MRDPQRLLSASSDSDALERELLTSLRDETAPAEAKRQLWNGIAAGLAAAAPASSAAAASGGGAAASLGGKGGSLWLAKWALISVVGAGAASGAYWVAREPAGLAATPPKRVPSSRPPSAAANAASQPAVAPLAPALESAPKPPRAAVVAHDKPNPLTLESELLRSARAQLRAGDLAGAERSLALQRKRFPRAALDQERDVLQIELLRARGDESAARKLAAKFLRAHPESPHAAQLRPLLAAP